jgi:alpha-L-fucosidase
MKLKSTLENGRPAIPVDIFDSKKGPKVIVVEIQGKPIVEESLTQTQADGRIVMNANNAKLQEGKGLKIIGAHTHDPNRPNAIGQWKDLADKVFGISKFKNQGSIVYSSIIWRIARHGDCARCSDSSSHGHS